MNVVPASHRAKKLAIHMGDDAGRQVDLMLQRQNTHGRNATRRDVSAGALGCLTATLPVQGNICFFIGAPINGPDIREITDADAAARLFPEFDGAFVGVFWDARQQVLVIATDCLGMQPLYMRHGADEVTWVSETKALRGAPDLAAWGAFISLGHPIGGRSLMHDLARVPPASILTYDCARKQLDIRRYWQWPAPSEVWRNYDFLTALERDIQACASFGDPGTLLLSGGFDSRLLLFLLKRAGLPVNALIVAHDDEHGDADGRFAEAVAKLAGASFRKVCPAPDFFSSSAYLDYLRASDVGYPSLDLFIAKVASQIDGTVVWDGLVPGCVFMPLHQPEGGFDAYLRQEIRGPDSPGWSAAKYLFKREVVEAMREGFAQDLQAEVSRLPRNAHGLARFVIENRSRHRAAMNPLKVYANRADAFVPGLSKDFMAHAATIPFTEKRHGRFYRQLFAQLDKKALNIPFLSGGKLMKGRSISPGCERERLRNFYYKQRARHPRLFPGTRHLADVRHSTFLGGHLLEAPDEWLDPSSLDRLTAPGADDQAVWKLLFHWKAWQSVHEGRLEQVLAPCRNAKTSPASE